MPRVTRAVAARHRQEAIAAASRLFLERGVAGVSVQTISQEVGLTHGFFYKQFASKDDLVESAVARAFDVLLEQIATSPMSEVLERCIAAGQRPNSGEDCPITAFAAVAYHAQTDPGLRQAFASGLRKVLESTGAGDRFLVALAACVGAAVIARATGGEALADQILAATATAARSESP